MSSWSAAKDLVVERFYGIRSFAALQDDNSCRFKRCSKEKRRGCTSAATAFSFRDTGFQPVSFALRSIGLLPRCTLTAGSTLATGAPAAISAARATLPTGPSRTTGATRATAAHLFHLFQLVRGENLRELRIDVFLKVGNLFLLIVRQVQRILKHGRKHLAGLRRTASPAGAARTAATATLSIGAAAIRGAIKAIGPAKSALATTAAAGGHFGFKLGRERGQFFTCDYAVFIGVRFFEEADQAFVGDFIPGEFPVLVGIKGHHAGDQ
jgi:hypothetical protein